LINETVNKCKSNIQVTNSSKWSQYLSNNESTYLIITSNRSISHSDFDKAINLIAHVLIINELDFNEKIVPYIGEDKVFTLNFTRERNCDVIQQFFYLYLVSAGVYIATFIGWVRILVNSQQQMLDCQKFITFLIIIKAYCDLSYLYHIIICEPIGDSNKIDKITYGVNNLLQPVFEGVFVFLLMSFAMVI
jgi:hypothetical protein